MPVLPALKPTGEMKCQEIRPEEAMPGSQGCPVITGVPSPSVRPLKIDADDGLLRALRQLPSRAPVQVETSRCRSNAAWQASVSWTRPSTAHQGRRNARAPPGRPRFARRAVNAVDRSAGFVATVRYFCPFEMLYSEDLGRLKPGAPARKPS